MRKNSSIIYLAIIVSFSCNKKLDYNLNNIYQGDKIVLNGFIDSELGCVVKVSKSSPSTGNYTYEQLKVKDVHVFLYENGDSILELKQDTSGKYTYSSFAPKIGSRYKIRATSLTLPECQSEEEIFDEVPLTKNETSVYSNNLSHGDSGVLFTFDFNLNTKKISYFIFYAKNDIGSTGAYLVNSNIDLSCGIQYLSVYDLVTSDCFNSGSKVKFEVAPKNLSGKSPTFAKLYISKISSVYYNYIQSLNQPINENFAFLEPNTLVTNINGGYGIFYTRNWKVFTYKF